MDGRTASRLTTAAFITKHVLTTARIKESDHAKLYI